MLMRPEERKNAIREELQRLGGKPFRFKDCPRVLALVVASDPGLRIGDASGHLCIKHHEDVIAQRLKGMSMDARVSSLELFLDSLSDGSPSGRPFARCVEMAEGPMRKGQVL